MSRLPSSATPRSERTGGHLALATEERRRRHRQTAQLGIERLRRRKVSGKLGGEELVEALSLDQIAQPVPAEVAEGDPRIRPRTRQGGDRPRQQDLAAVGGTQQPSDPVHMRAEVVVPPLFCCAGVDRHPHPQATDLHPRGRRQRPLGGDRGANRRVRGEEDGAEGIPHGLEDVAAGVLDGAAHKRVMPGKRHRHRLGVVLPAAGAPLDIREEEGDGPARPLRHQRASTPTRPAAYSSGEASRNYFTGVRAVTPVAATSSSVGRAVPPSDQHAAGISAAPPAVVRPSRLPRPVLVAVRRGGSDSAKLA